MNGEDYEAGKPVPAKTYPYGDPWVSDHLPDCYQPEQKIVMPCICDRLRACEARVEKFWRAESDARVEQQIDVTRTATLQAARDAVAARRDQGYPGINDALAAIDALKGEQA